MSETEFPAPPPAPDPAPPPEPAPAPPPPARRSGTVAALLALLAVLLFGAVAWLWDRQQRLSAAEAARPAVAPEQLAALQHRLDALAQQVSALQQRPVPAPAPVDLHPLEARIAALEQRRPSSAPDLGPLEQKLDSAAAAAQAAKSAEADVTGRLAGLEQRLGTAEQQASRLAGKAAQAQRIEQAQVALDAGEKLGAIPGAPPALARFAEQKPPTEAGLRLSFPAAAAEAEQASRPSTAGTSFGERMWLRARALVTVRQGDRVLLGTPAAQVLGQAQARLDAGDLAGALAALDGLDGTAAQAMAPWRERAQALLDARAALAQMARG